MSDPLGMLGLDPYDWAIAVEVTNEAQKIEGERRKAELEALIVGIGNRVGNHLSQALKAMRL